MAQKQLFIIDGSSFLYRAYYSIKPLTTRDGENIQAVYAFSKMLKKLIVKFNIKDCIVVWDSKEKNHRHQLFPAYKANRVAPPSDLFTQKQRITEFLNLIGIQQLTQEGVEADDVIFSLALDFKKLGHKIFIVSSDKDLYQILDIDIFLYDSFKEILIDKSYIEKKFSFDLKQLPFYFSLLGDASDNIPGVSGVGKVTATKLVQQFESLNSLYENLDKITSQKLQNCLKENKEAAFTSFELFKLKYFKQNLEKINSAFDFNNWNNCKALFELLEFKSLLKEFDIEYKASSIFNSSNINFLHEKYIFKKISTEEELKILSTELKNYTILALDTETDGLNPLSNKLIGISLAFKQGSAFYIPIAHENTAAQLTITLIKKYLEPFLNNSAITKVFHNAKFDCIVLKQAAIKLDTNIFDTLIAASLICSPNIKKNLKSLSEFFFEERMISFKELETEYKFNNFAELDIQTAANYSCADAHQTLKLFYIFKQQLAQKNLENLFYKIEMPTNQILIDMEITGIYCNTSILSDFKIKLDLLIEATTAEIYNLATTPINLNSPKQLETLLFEKFKLPKQTKTTKKTQFSTDSNALKTLSKLHILPKLILNYRELFKLKSTYIDALPQFINEKTGKIHSTFSQTTVATGRLSSSNPNLQNIPVTKKINVRAAFTAQKNFIFLAADYSQIELRVLAALTADTKLVAAFAANLDVHRKTAAKLFNKTEQEITESERAIGKKINFSIIYGLSAYGLSKDLEIPLNKAKEYIKAYFEEYSGVAKWSEQIILETIKCGFVQTFFGRKREIPELKECNKLLFEQGKRYAINTIIQGTAAEIMKLGMISTSKNLIENNIAAKLLLQIHDELLFEVKESELDTAIKSIKKSLENLVIPNFKIPLIVNIKIGNNWGDLK